MSAASKHIGHTQGRFSSRNHTHTDRHTHITAQTCIEKHIRLKKKSGFLYKSLKLSSLCTVVRTIFAIHCESPSWYSAKDIYRWGSEGVVSIGTRLSVGAGRNGASVPCGAHGTCLLPPYAVVTLITVSLGGGIVTVWTLLAWWAPDARLKKTEENKEFSD